MKTAIAKVPPGIAILLSQIADYRARNNITHRAFYQMVVTQLRGKSPAISSMRQHLAFWQNSWVCPKPHHLYVYAVICKLPLTMLRVQTLYDFPEEGAKPKVYPPLGD